MSQWLGFGDLVRRDDLSIGYPLGDFHDHMSRYMPCGDDKILNLVPSVADGLEQDYLVRWFEDIYHLMDSLSHVMSKKCRASILAPDESYNGVNIPKAEIITEIASLCELECEKEGTGVGRCVVLKRPQ